MVVVTVAVGEHLLLKAVPLLLLPAVAVHRQVVAIVKELLSDWMELLQPAVWLVSVAAVPAEQVAAAAEL